MQRIDFSVLPDAGGTARLRLASRIVEREYLEGRRVLVWSDDAQALAAFDDQLWTFSDRAFVPHETLGSATGPVVGAEAVPVLLAAGSAANDLAGDAFALLLNLGTDVPAFASRYARIAEVIDNDAERRQAGRQRFKRYRDQGLAPVTHNLAGDDALP